MIFLPFANCKISWSSTVKYSNSCICFITFSCHCVELTSRQVDNLHSFKKWKPLAKKVRHSTHILVWPQFWSTVLFSQQNTDFWLRNWLGQRVFYIWIEFIFVRVNKNHQNFVFKVKNQSNDSEFFSVQNIRLRQLSVEYLVLLTFY